MTDRITVRLVVGLLGCITLVGVLLGGFLALNEKAVPDFLIGVTNLAGGGLVGILAKTSSEVTVANPASNPVHVTDAPSDKGSIAVATVVVLVLIGLGVLYLLQLIF